MCRRTTCNDAGAQPWSPLTPKNRTGKGATRAQRAAEVLTRQHHFLLTRPFPDCSITGPRGSCAPLQTPNPPRTDLLRAQPLGHGAQLRRWVLHVGDGDLQETRVLLLRVPCREKNKNQNNKMPEKLNFRFFFFFFGLKQSPQPPQLLGWDAAGAAFGFGAAS